MGHRYASLDWQLVEARRDACAAAEASRPWGVCRDNFLLLPQILPSSDGTAAHYGELNQGLTLGAGIGQYIDVHGKDPHLLEPLLQLRHAVAATGFDPNCNLTTSDGIRPYFLVAFATGDGTTLQALVRRFRPHHLLIAVADWHDFATSFWHLNWAELSRVQEHDHGGKLTIGCYKDGQEILSFLCGECHAGIDYALLYLPPEGGCDQKARQLRQEITQVDLTNSVTYLGYTIDEHNMVWNTWQTLARQPRVFRKPQQPLGGRMVVCGSGPSLDANLNGLRELSRTHWITACGSNFRTLKANGIRVDLLALVERADEVLADVQMVVNECGAGETRLVMSTTCHHQLQGLFRDAMVYFRPALTPLALFSNSPAEVLNFEGPESINTGVALAAALGIDELVLVGVDLGARSLQKVRSDDAVGCSVRDLSTEVPANFGGTVLTSSLLRDSRLAVETCLRCCPSLQIFNASDGVAIAGAKACTLDTRLAALAAEVSLPGFPESFLGQWWQASQRYTPERFLASWASRRPRAEAASLVTSLRRLFISQDPWNPVVIAQVTQLLALVVSPAVQFPRRVLRSTIHKLVIAVNRQLLVMAAEPKQAIAFEQAARRILADLLDPLELELYALCDAVEALPAQRPCDYSPSSAEAVDHA